MALRSTGTQRLSKTTNLPTITSWTVMFWNLISVNLAATTTFFKFGGVGEFSYRLGYNDVNLQFAVRSEGNSTINGSTLSLNRWHHIAATCSGTGAGQFLAYLNGKLDVVQTGCVTADSGNMVFFDQSPGSSVEPHNGCIEGIHIYDRVLTGEEIRREMKQHAPLNWQALNVVSPIRTVEEAAINYGGLNDPWTVSGTFTQEAGPGIPWLVPPDRRPVRTSASSNYVRRERGIRGLHRGLSVGVG